MLQSFKGDHEFDKMLNFELLDLKRQKESLEKRLAESPCQDDAEMLEIVNLDIKEVEEALKEEV